MVYCALVRSHRTMGQKHPSCGIDERTRYSLRVNLSIFLHFHRDIIKSPTDFRRSIHKWKESDHLRTKFATGHG